tara:strand:+ start:5360 stop:5587 length:228 start_codon:yes stop_codon:yes gene_type:complete
MTDLAEQIARMDQTEREVFVHDFVASWPELAYDIKEAIQIEIFDQRQQKEQEDLKVYSRMFSEQPLVLTKDMEVK